ncbi:BJ4_G0007150.mRNA.1.CDS.1 [Saccharomyces cerevisiae]|nr:BJ4_G0007150.mRNA.1.CDS.1 [Saccharomyces cerevisiae]
MNSDTNAFKDIRISCVELSRIAFLPTESFDPNSLTLLACLKKVEEKLSAYEDDSLSPKFADYVFVPIASLLKQPALGESQTEYVLLIIFHLLRTCWSSNGKFSEQLGQQLFPLITFLVSSDKDNQKLITRSDEFKYAGCLVLHQFFKSVRSQRYHKEFFSNSKPNLLPALGHSVTILLKILEQSPQNNELQFKALASLEVLFQDIISDGEMLSFILPGNVSVFAKILTKPGRQIHYKVCVRTLEVLAKLLVLVYDDFSLDIKVNKLTDIRELSDTKLKHEINQSFMFNGPIVLLRTDGKTHRDTRWLTATSGQINIALEAFIPKLLKRNNESIDEALATFVSILLTRCENSLNNCEKVLVSTLVHLERDPMSKLPSHLVKLKEVVNEDLHKLSDIIRFENADRLSSLSFAITILEKNNERYTMINEVVRCLFESLNESIEPPSLINHKERIIEQSSQLTTTVNFENLESTNALIALPRLSEDMSLKLKKFTYHMGSLLLERHILNDVVTELISEQVDSPRTQKIVALWLSTNFIKAMEKQPKEEEVYLQFESDANYSSSMVEEVCLIVLEFCNELSQDISMEIEGKGIKKSDEFAVCTVLFSIETICAVMREEFQPELIDYIYTVVDALASPSEAIRYVGQSCALRIADTLYHGSIPNMILSNVDYLVESISSRLNSGMTERVSQILMVICQLAGYETIENFKDVIETIFKLLDYYHGYSDLCLQFFQLFKIIILEMKKKYINDDEMILKIANQHISQSTFSPWGMTDFQQVLNILDKETQVKDDITDENDVDFLKDDNEPSNFQEYFDSKLREPDSDDDEEEREEEVEGSSNEYTDQWTSPIPSDSYKILLQILGYGERLLTHPSKRLRVQILIVMRLIFPLLSTQHNLLIREVASTWDSIIQCVLCSDYSIVQPACSCVEQMIKYSGDFVAKRFIELWQKLCQDSFILKELRIDPTVHNHEKKSISKHVKFPPVTENALVSMVHMVLEGVKITEYLISEAVLEQIIYCCIQVVPVEKISSMSLIVGDIVWKIRNIN